MGFNYFGAILALVTAYMLSSGLAETVVVGGSEGWRYGYNYTDWALRHGPFYINDTLVFKYPSPENGGRPHSVYLLPNLYSYVTCDFSKGRMLSSPSEGDGNGSSYVLSHWRPHYFASGEGNATDCTQGLMKFVAIPLPPWVN